MANLVENAQWEAGIYQFETSDPVEGGPDGIDNVQPRQLANRTAYLKAQQEVHAGAADPHPQYQTQAKTQALITAAINALVAAAPGVLDTLNELADALGDDPHFATTMTNALALKAPIDSPEFTGTVKVPTQAITDNSKLSASTAFVQALIAAGFQSTGKVNAVNGANLLPNGSGEFGNFGWSSSAFTASPGGNGEGPLFSNGAAINSATNVIDASSPIAMGAGVSLTVQGEIFAPSLTKGNAYFKLDAFDVAGNLISTICTTVAISAVNTAFQFVSATGVTPAGTAQVKVSKVLDGAPVAAIAGVRYRRIKLESGTKPSINSGEASIASLAALFSSLNSGNGYFKLPNGLIVQWGTSGSNASGIATLVLPIAFPNALLVANCNYLLSGTALGVAGQMSSSSNRSTLIGNVFITSNGAPVNAGTVWFISIGF